MVVVGNASASLSLLLMRKHSPPPTMKSSEASDRADGIWPGPARCSTGSAASGTRSASLI